VNGDADGEGQDYSSHMRSGDDDAETRWQPGQQTHEYAPPPTKCINGGMVLGGLEKLQAFKLKFPTASRSAA